MDSAASSPWPAVLRLVFGGMATHVVALAVRLRLPDAIGDEERDAAGVAAEYGFQEGPMLRLLRALAALDLLAEPRPGRFTVTPVGALFRSDRPGSMYPLARMLTDPTMTSAWQNLEFSLRTGGPAFDEAFGIDFFGYLSSQPELSELYNAAMSQGTRGVARVLAGAYDFGRFRTVVDVGGGDGTSLVEILAAHPRLGGVLFDSPSGVDAAEQNLEAAGLTARCRIETGDFFSEVPRDGDLYLLKSVIHGWDDEHAAVILRNCARAAREQGRILLVDHLMPDTVQPGQSPTTYLTDLGLLVNGQGMERTRDDFAGLCAKAGLRIAEVGSLPSTGFHWIELCPD
ncbi:methyltransferase [Micromonospora sp. WMMD956]|uniref:methyltransferase n=1 Tax=Micromonospora TaxID=1873 RepID=UPI002415BB14|nr:methyltransferase [Micromonospora sp. WMMD956]MDG4817098.1 methyltransferase [Micromonospora sp. WMMD956]